MTVAASSSPRPPESALADADGMPAVRRIADAAWSGGATPIVVVSFDPDGAVAAALAGSPVTLAEPAPREDGPKAQMARGADVAQAEVGDTDAFLLWPARLAWVGPETVTSLIELHGTESAALLRPTWDGDRAGRWSCRCAGLTTLRAVAADRMPASILDDLIASGLADHQVDLGDPGVAIDVATPRRDLPPYLGPEEPAAGHIHEWGAAQAEESDEGPLEGPSLAPYAPAGADTEAG